MPWWGWLVFAWGNSALLIGGVVWISDISEHRKIGAVAEQIAAALEERFTIQVTDENEHR